MSIKLSSQKKLESWLDENYWFQDGNCLGVTIRNEVKEIDLTLAYQIKGTYEANSERISRVFKITVVDILEISEIESNDFNPEHCMEGFESFDSDEGIKFSIDLPKKLNITCKSIFVSEKDELIDIVKPWFSDIEIFVQVNDSSSVPNAKVWVNWFKEDGVDVSWRCYGGKARESSSIPNGNYEGWYLQEISAISRTTEGLFFQHLKTEGDSLGFHVRRNEFSDRYWLLFEKYLLKICDLKIYCGNCKLNHQDWESYLNDVQNHG